VTKHLHFPSRNFEARPEISLHFTLPTRGNISIFTLALSLPAIKCVTFRNSIPIITLTYLPSSSSRQPTSLTRICVVRHKQQQKEAEEKPKNFSLPQNLFSSSCRSLAFFLLSFRRNKNSSSSSSSRKKSSVCVRVRAKTDCKNTLTYIFIRSQPTSHPHSHPPLQGERRKKLKTLP
jgi:hypothetical protein